MDLQHFLPPWWWFNVFSKRVFLHFFFNVANCLRRLSPLPNIASNFVNVLVDVVGGLARILSHFNGDNHFENSFWHFVLNYYYIGVPKCFIIIIWLANSDHYISSYPLLKCKLNLCPNWPTDRKEHLDFQKIWQTHWLKPFSKWLICLHLLTNKTLN